MASRVRCSSASPSAGSSGMDSSAGKRSSSGCGVRISCHEILRQRHDMGPAGGRIGAELRAHPLLGGHHLQQGALMASCSFCPLALNKRG